MGLFNKIKDLLLTKSEKPKGKAVNFLAPKQETRQPVSFLASKATQVTAPPPPLAFTVAKPRGRPLKSRFLHMLSWMLIVLNIGLGIFFYSNNPMFNTALYVYLGVSTILLGHYYSLTRG